ncbi:MAG: ATP-binding protein [Bacteroidota bacterium]
MKKIVITGPECTGKTTLAKALAEHYKTKWVPEYARQYLDELDREYREEDLLKIAKGQLKLEDQIGKECNGLLFCDTDLTVLKIWQEYKYGRCFEEILSKLKTRKYKLHLLLAPDVPWEFDFQRENPNDRKKLFKMYESELATGQYTYQTISGNFDSRVQKAIKAIDTLI